MKTTAAQDEGGLIVSAATIIYGEICSFFSCFFICIKNEGCLSLSLRFWLRLTWRWLWHIATAAGAGATTTHYKV